MEPLLGSLLLFAGDYVPAGWMECNGETLQISDFSALFSVIGTTFGGDGTTNFNIPSMTPPGGGKWLIAVQGVYPNRP